MRRALQVASLLALLAIVGCSSSAPSAPTELTGRWLDESGKPVPDGSERRGNGFPFVAHSTSGSAHCGWESVVFMSVAWPPGTEIDSPDQVRHFIRDSDDVLESVRLLGTLDLTATLPFDARSSGLHRRGNEIWVSDSVGDRYIFVKRRDESVERWPRTASQANLCA